MRRWRYRRLQHQLFVWLAFSILASVLAALLVFGFMRSLESPAGLRFRQLSAFASRQFAERWHDPAARQAFARELAEVFEVTIWLEDAKGELLVREGAPECHAPRHELDVGLDGVRLGHVRACFHGQHRFGALTFVLVLGSMCLVLWTAAALVSRRITRPLSLLVGTTREIGSGNLSARVRLGRHQGGELGLLAESVNDMAERIERQMRDQRELLAAVSHEVRSPLARLRVCAELLRGGGPNLRALDAIEREVEDLDVLVGKLLASSRLDFETLVKKSVVAAELCREALERRKLPATLLSDQTHGQRVDVDATLISRALDNLLDNAARHGGGARGCTVRLEPTPDAAREHAARAGQGAEMGQRTRSMLIFEVHDAGAGFAAETLPRAFDAFYSDGRSSHDLPGSLGLGLALVRRIALAHGGQAWAENMPDIGARVSFSVSLAQG
jgi:two-component system, OmpR family, sensor kinase